MRRQLFSEDPAAYWGFDSHCRDAYNLRAETEKPVRARVVVRLYFFSVPPSSHMYMSTRQNTTAFRTSAFGFLKASKRGGSTCSGINECMG